MATTQKRLTQPDTPPSQRRYKPSVHFGRELCGSLESAEQREWLVTNGIGGFASGTVSGHATRRRGCIAQAWTVGETLRAWRFLHG